MKTKTIVLLALVVFVMNATAQETAEIIEYQNDIKALSSQPPFDKGFLIKIKKDSSQFFGSLELTRLDKKGKPKHFTKRELKIINDNYKRRVIPTMPNTSLIQPKKAKEIVDLINELESEKAKDGTTPSRKAEIVKKNADLNKRLGEVANFYSVLLDSVQIELPNSGISYIPIYPLEPASHYSLEFTLSSFNDDAIIKALEKLVSGTSVDIPGDFKIVMSNDAIKAGNYTKAVAYLLHYDENLASIPLLASSFDKLEIEYNRVINNSSDVSCFYSVYAELVESNFDCDKCINQKLTDTICFNACKDYINFSIVNHLDSVGQGLVSIDSDMLHKEANPSISARMENYQNTYRYIDLICTHSNTKGQDVSDCEATLIDLKKNIDDLKKLQADIKALGKEISRYQIGQTDILAHVQSEEFSTSTGGYTTLDTKGKFVVRPDFGVGLVSNRLVVDENNQSFTTVVPFLGVRLNFRPLDPDIPYKNLPYKTFAHRSSVNISFSLTSIGNGEDRFDLYEKTSFLLGYGFRVSNSLNLNAGAIFFSREDTSPLVSGTRFTALPYVGLSVDFEILQIFKDIKDVF